ncbi:MAG: hypothetical protein FWD72_05645 [Eggerthellaceae bacterium]|nr:hypothetical protein [Eggerthellaceae bacterium]
MITYNDKYDANEKVMKDVVAFKNDHVATAYAGMATPANYYGVTIAEHMLNPEAGLKRHYDYVAELAKHGPINAVNTGYTSTVDIFESMIWWSHVKMPGLELPENSVWQVEEKTNISADDYDFIIDNGYMAMTQRLMPTIISPERMAAFGAFMQEDPEPGIQYVVDQGLPNTNSSLHCPPFETLCGGRGMHKFFMDCYKMPDKVKAVQDAMMADIRGQIMSQPDERFMFGSWVGGWRGASSMVNQKIWDTLVWPYMLEMSELLHSKGIVPVLHLDASWTRDLARFKELPAKSCILNTDGMTDLREAHRILGDHVALMGDVPVQMLALSSRDEVFDYTRRLIEDVGPQGLIICAGCDAPADAKFENMAAMYEAAAEY